MPPTNPKLTRSSSDPNLQPSVTNRSTPAARVPVRSVCSSSAKNSHWLLHWTSINKFIYPIKKTTRSKPDCDLTEESLVAHNLRQAIINDSKSSSCNYRGLADFSLVINRRKQPSPERESYGSNATTSSTSLSSLMFKAQEWGGSCFTTNNKNIAHKRNKEVVKKVTTIVVSGTTTSEQIKKPLRETDSEPRTCTIQSDRVENRVIDGGDDDDVKKPMMVKQFVWADMYRPKILTDFICNRDKALHLQTLMKGPDFCGHFIFEGPKGVGKRTMIWAMLREVYGADRVKTREEYKAFDLTGESIDSIKVHLKKSSRHVEVNLSDLKGYEKHVIVQLIKETHGRMSKKSSQPKLDYCRAIILYEADKLSTDALLYMRWILERYKGFNKVFFCCSDVSKLQAIRNLCTVVQLSPPSKQEIIEVLEFVAKQEQIELPRQLAEKIADNAKNNLRQAIRSFEASWQKRYPIIEDKDILTGWEDDIATIAKNIVEEQSPKQLYTVRGKLQNLVEHDVSRDYILKSLADELSKHLDEQLQFGLKNLYQEYSKNNGHMFEGGKSSVRKNFHQFIRIEEFVAKFMSLYKCSEKNKKSKEREETVS